MSPVKGKRMFKVRFTEGGRDRIQHYGEQHPDFHAAHRENKRLYPEKFKRSK